MEHLDNEFNDQPSGKTIISVHSEDTYVFVSLVCKMYREEMIRWDMIMLGHGVCSSMTCTPLAIGHNLISIPQSQN